MIQTKLVVGTAGDRYEREADHMAQVVLRSLNGQDGATREPEFEAGESRVSRKASSSVDPLGGTSIDAGSEAAIVRSGGVALPPAVRARMEAAFGADFGAVRIHQGPGVDQLSSRLQARAFTSGSDIFFASGGYRPASPSGRALLAHELTHVVQQGAAGPIGRVPSRPAAEGGTSLPVTLHRSGRTVQRAILAIDGTTDDRDALQATRNCLANLTSHKQLPTSLGKLVQHYPADDARGQVFGPGVATAALASLTAGISAIGPLETLYFLGHGTTTAIAGLTPPDLATQLVTAFAKYPGTFTGAFKIVACYSASTLQFGGTVLSFSASAAKSYADRLNSALDTKNSPKFRPRFVEGIRGIAWADEDTGQRVGYDVRGERPGELNPLESVYADPKQRTAWFGALTHPHPATRKREMDIFLGGIHGKLGLLTTDRRVTGKAARERYLSSSARSDFEGAAKLLRSTAKSDKPNLVLAMTALKRMVLDWQTMDTAERKAMRKEAILAYGAYQIVFEDRLPSPRDMDAMWVL